MFNNSKINLVLSFLLGLLLFPTISFSTEYVADGELFVIDLDKDWNKTKSNDPTSVMKLEKGKDFIEITKLEDELSDFYLKARLKEQMDDLKNKGVVSLSDIKSASIHSVSNAYYISYTRESQTNIISFLTYAGNSYAIIANGINEGNFKDLIYSFRKPGEKIEIKKPKPLPPKKIKIAKKEKEEENEFINFSTKEWTTEIKTEEEESHPFTFQSTTIATSVQKEDQLTKAQEQAQKLVAKMAEKTSSFGGEPYIKRQPLNKFNTLIILILWLVLSRFLGFIGSKIPNPKLTPYPQEVPPDFFFPFIITRVSTLKETLYQIITRQKQVLSASYNHESKFITCLGIYGIIFLHLFWSLSQFVSDSFFNNLLLSFPFGRLIASFPELPFILLAIWGLMKKITLKQKLVIHDSQMNIVMEVLQDKNFYAVLKDGQGKEVARLHKKGSILRRQWYFTDLDNQVAFTIMDEHPYIYLASRFFGSQKGKLRNRYGIFVDNKRVGFLFIDHHSKDSFQIHQEYDYARVAHPAQILASLLYIISRERERFLLTF